MPTILNDQFCNKKFIFTRKNAFHTPPVNNFLSYFSISWGETDIFDVCNSLTGIKQKAICMLVTCEASTSLADVVPLWFPLNSYQETWDPILEMQYITSPVLFLGVL